MNFIKMEAAGNDFLLIDANNKSADWPALAKSMCHRHKGVGADGLILVLPSSKADFAMRMFNPDGSEAEMCGNGIACFAKHVIEAKLSDSKVTQVTIETPAGMRTVQAQREGNTVASVRVSMGLPQFRAKQIPMLVPEGDTPILDYPLQVGEMELRLSCLSMGNPHAVAFVEDVASFPLDQIGPRVEHHPIFPRRVNFEVAQVMDKSQIKARVWERGAGETLSCGTGACAVAVAAQLKELAEKEVDIIYRGGTMTVAWDRVGEVFLSTHLAYVFKGEWASAN
ncbi:MAG: diaminopimelate epimerase [Chloroflexi bacterium]|nr:diaminopimelate epimerase [Chloroflexota bacterium]